jgi:hypothetical protein
LGDAIDHGKMPRRDRDVTQTPRALLGRARLQSCRKAADSNQAPQGTSAFVMFSTKLLRHAQRECFDP